MVVHVFPHKTIARTHELSNAAPPILLSIHARIRAARNEGRLCLVRHSNNSEFIADHCFDSNEEAFLSAFLVRADETYHTSTTLDVIEQFPTFHLQPHAAHFPLSGKYVPGFFPLEAYTANEPVLALRFF